MKELHELAIVGVGQTKQERAKDSETFADIVYEATRKALDDAGLEISDIDNIITVSNDFCDGRSISSMAIQDAAGANQKNVSTVEGDGTYGAFYGASRILSGSYENTLVVTHSKGSQGNPAAITNGMFEPIFSRPLGLDMTLTGAMQAKIYMNRFGVTEEDLAKVSVKNHNNALSNSNAQLRKKISVDDVMNSRRIAPPLKLYDVSPITDGAATVIIGSQKTIDKSKSKPVFLKGVGTCSDFYDIGMRNLAKSPALVDAANRAYKMAGITKPIDEIDIAELYDAFSYMELMWYEGLGLCGEGEGKNLIRDNVTSIDGKIPVNASGGVLSAHAVVSAGLIRMIEVVHQLRGTAGEMQVKKDLKTGLAHGIGGVCAQSHCVWILGN